ncbi:hypothetical protein Enr13x_14300 [Stieleria neptunia]|uniref:Uncharacterized protein n=1 Tax=Stieleria neptunia TaxID=2527979 RepID=A0A518HL63_9BACT|nr:hypothetical protein Enr13x_14300 [Stieleria neptunia]
MVMKGSLRIQKVVGDMHQLRRSQWMAIAESDPELTDPPPRMGRNPANGQLMQLRLPPDERALETDGEIIGRFFWDTIHYPSPGSDGPAWDDELGTVTANYALEHEDHVRSIAELFASIMDAELVLD